MLTCHHIRKCESSEPVLLGHYAGPLVEHEAGLEAEVHVGHVGQSDGEQGPAGDGQARVLGKECCYISRLAQC